MSIRMITHTNYSHIKEDLISPRSGIAIRPNDNDDIEIIPLLRYTAARLRAWIALNARPLSYLEFK